MKKVSVLQGILFFLLMISWNPASSQWECVGDDCTPGDSKVPLCILEKDGYIFFGDLGTGVYRLEPATNTWTHLTVAGINLIYDLVIFDGKIWCAVDGSGVLSSEDYGATWLDKNAGLTHQKVYALAVCNNMLFCGTYHGGIFRYDNGTGMWSPVNNGFSYSPDKWYALELGTIGTIIYLYSVGIGVWYTDNFGEGWYSLNNMYYDGNAEVHDFIDHGGYIMIPADYLGVMRSSNGGQTWDYCNEGMTSQQSVKSMAATSQAVFVGTSDSGVFMSTDHGDHWEMANLGFPWDYQTNRYATVYSMEVIGDYLYVGTWWYGMRRASLSDLYAGLMTVPRNDKPAAVLCQNQPNPFNSCTEIRYALSREGPVSLIVYDIFGKKVASLVDEVQQPGEYSVWYKPDPGLRNNGNGVYFYRLTDRSTTLTKKMLFIR